jgi:hypothetical protein
MHVAASIGARARSALRIATPASFAVTQNLKELQRKVAGFCLATRARLSVG